METIISLSSYLYFGSFYYYSIFILRLIGWHFLCEYLILCSYHDNYNLKFLNNYDFAGGTMISLLTLMCCAIVVICITYSNELLYNGSPCPLIMKVTWNTTTSAVCDEGSSAIPEKSRHYWSTLDIWSSSNTSGKSIQLHIHSRTCPDQQSYSITETCEYDCYQQVNDGCPDSGLTSFQCVIFPKEPGKMANLTMYHLRLGSKGVVPSGDQRFHSKVPPLSVRPIAFRSFGHFARKERQNAQ